MNWWYVRCVRCEMRVCSACCTRCLSVCLCLNLNVSKHLSLNWLHALHIIRAGNRKYEGYKLHIFLNLTMCEKRTLIFRMQLNYVYSTLYWKHQKIFGQFHLMCGVLSNYSREDDTLLTIFKSYRIVSNWDWNRKIQSMKFHQLNVNWNCNNIG